MHSQMPTSPTSHKHYQLLLGRDKEKKPKENTLLVVSGVKLYSHMVLYSILPLTPISLNSSIHN